MNRREYRPFQLTERDEEILRCLALYVRLLSQRQLSQHWFHSDVANTRRRMKLLCQQGLLEKAQVRARSLPVIKQPLVVWRPGEAEPGHAAISYRCRQRWRPHPVRDCTAYLATQRTAQLFGGVARGGISKQLQVTHDLGVAQIWLRLDITNPDWADAWRGEDFMAETRYRQKLPDGFIVNDAGQPLYAVEFGGSYDAQRVQEFHADCAARELPYQLW